VAEAHRGIAAGFRGDAFASLLPICWKESADRTIGGSGGAKSEPKWSIDHGRMPPAPDNLRAIVTARETRVGLRCATCASSSGRPTAASCGCKLLIPPGPAPFPFISPIIFAINRGRPSPCAGYLGCIYHATDLTMAEGRFRRLHRALSRLRFFLPRALAWAASRAIDYLVTLPEVDKAKIAISGHSRNGKTGRDRRSLRRAHRRGRPLERKHRRRKSLAVHERALRHRKHRPDHERHPHWFVPRLRVFCRPRGQVAGGENSLMALIAPRALLLTSAYTESAGTAIGFEQNYRSLRSVYALLGAPGNIGLTCGPEDHPTTPGTSKPTSTLSTAYLAESGSPLRRL